MRSLKLVKSRSKKSPKSTRRSRLERLELRSLLANLAPSLAREIPDLNIQAEVPFQFDLRPTGSVVFGMDVGGVDIRATDNLFAGSVNFLKPWNDVTFTGNTIVNDSPFRAAELRELPTNYSSQDYVWDNNSYVTNTAKPFIFDGTAGGFDQWQNDSGFDAQSLLASEISGTTIDVRPNAYQPGRRARRCLQLGSP